MIDMNRVKNWKVAFDMLDEQNGPRTLIKYMKGDEVIEVTAGEFFKDVRKAASGLQRHQLNGKHIGVIGKNSYDWVVSFCAVLYTGGVAVLLNKDYTTEEIIDVIERTDVEVMLYDHALEGKMPWEQKISWVDMQSSDKANVISLAKEKELETLCIENRAAADDLALILFTSGTTGKSKAVMHTNGTLICNSFAPLLIQMPSMLLPMPFHHVIGYGAILFGMCAGTIICIGEEIGHIFKYLEKMRPTCTPVVPALMKMIAQKLRRVNSVEDLNWSLNMLMSGGAAFEKGELEPFVEKGIMVRQNYAASESGGKGIEYTMSLDNLDTIGKANIIVEAKLVDGELVMRGPGFATGYYKDEEATKEAFRGGWYYTGDLCRQDENGYYYLVGRKKNLIILSNGENVSPEEIEAKLQIQKEVCEILVGEERDFIKAEIFPNYPANVSEEEKLQVQEKIKEYVRAYNNGVPTYKQIKILNFREEPFEKTAIGKIVRH